MRNLTLFLLSLATGIGYVSCGGHKAETVDTDTTGVATSEEEAPRNSTRDYFNDKDPVVPIVYNSSLAKVAPAYNEDTANKGPLTMFSPQNQESDIMDITPYKELGAWFYSPVFKNNSDKTVRIKEVHCPDSVFDLYWRVGMEMEPRLFGAVWMRVSEPVDVDDYRIVVTYENDEYPPQTFYLNLHSKGIAKTADD